MTRAKRRVIFFDKDISARAPLFELLRAMGVAQVANADNMMAGGGDTVPEEGGAGGVSWLAEASDRSSWKRRGLDLLEKGIFKEAARIFAKSGDTDLELEATARQLLDEAAELTATDEEGARARFFDAACAFLRAELLVEAARAFAKAGEEVYAKQLQRAIDAN
jgi:hypothetical protein